MSHTKIDTLGNILIGIGLICLFLTAMICIACQPNFETKIVQPQCPVTISEDDRAYDFLHVNDDVYFNGEMYQIMNIEYGLTERISKKEKYTYIVKQAYMTLKSYSKI